jgi:hypothetical protein
MIQGVLMDLKIIKDEEKEKKTPTGYPPGTIVCHRFMIPHLVHHDIQNPVGPGVSCQAIAQMGFIPCIREQCSLWDRESKEPFKCAEVLAHKMAIRYYQGLAQAKANGGNHDKT